MRILLLGPYPVRGPLPKLVPLLAEALRGAGHDVTYERWGRHRDDETAWDKLRDRVGDLVRIRALLKRDPHDVLFVTSAHDWATIARDLPLLASCRRLVRHRVLQIHGTLTGWLAPQGPRLEGLATRLLLRHCDAVLVSSRAEQEAFARFEPRCPSYAVDNIYLPDVGQPVAMPAEWGLPPGKPLVFFAGRLYDYKGVRDLMAAWPRVRERVDAHLLVAGLGPLEREVEDWVRGPAAAGSATWVRFLSRELLDAAYRATTVFVLPTYHDEGFPAVVQDALAHGLPIVTTANRGVADHLVDRVNTWYVPPRDPPSLADALVGLLRDADARAAMGEANRDKSRSFAPEVVVRQYCRVLEDLEDARR